MNLQKCKECGGVIFTDGPLTCKCTTCEKEYERDYMELYQEHTNFTSEFGNNAKQLFNSMKSAELSTLINAFMLQYSLSFGDEDELFYASYEVELNLACYAAQAIQNAGEDFENYPTDTNCTNKFGGVLANCRDVLYAVCEKSDGKISYEWIMNYLSNIVLGPVIRAKNCASDRWARYSHEEDDDGWHEYISVLTNCLWILDILDEYGNVSLGSVYETHVNILKTGINLSYIHKYWNGYYYATQNIGHTPESKATWEKHLAESQKKLDAFNHKKVELEEKRRKEEEARLEAEKQARIEKFWAKNKELKKQLLSEKEECEAKIEKLEAKRDGINADKEIAELKEEIQIANSTLASLGLFALKEKKAKKEQIAQLNREIYQQKDKVTKAKEEVQKEIDSIKNRIDEIDNEFTIDRE